VSEDCSVGTDVGFSHKTSVALSYIIPEEFRLNKVAEDV
jgi:hypothetical protein